MDHPPESKLKPTDDRHLGLIREFRDQFFPVQIYDTKTGEWKPFSFYDTDNAPVYEGHVTDAVKAAYAWLTLAGNDAAARWNATRAEWKIPPFSWMQPKIDEETGMRTLIYTPDGKRAAICNVCMFGRGKDYESYPKLLKQLDSLFSNLVKQFELMEARGAWKAS